MKTEEPNSLRISKIKKLEDLIMEARQEAKEGKILEGDPRELLKRFS